MAYLITTRDNSLSPLTIESNNWMLALEQALDKWGLPYTLEELHTKEGDSDVGEAIAPDHSKHFDIKPSLRSLSMTDELEFDPPELLPPPPKNNDALVDQEQYMPGMTTDILTNSFMKLSELSANYGTQYKDAIAFLLDTLSEGLKADGHGVLLTNLNDPSGVLWFEDIRGAHAEELANIQLSPGQGLIGYAAKQGSSLHLANIHDHERAEHENILQIVPLMGPLLALPIQHEQRLYGMFVLYRTKNHPFTEGEKSILTYFCSTLGEYLSQLPSPPS